MIRALAVLACAALAACGGGAASPLQPTQIASAPVSSCTPRVVSVALLGDSTMVGMDGASPGNQSVAPHNPGVELQADMDARFGAGAVVVTDYGVAGSTALQANPVKADVVVANYGINDMRTYGESIADYTAAMRAVGATLIETQNPIVGGSTWNEDDFVAAAKGLGLPVADTHTYVLGLSDWQSYLGPIGIHPDDALYVLIVDNVLAPAVAAQVAPLRCVQ